MNRKNRGKSQPQRGKKSFRGGGKGSKFTSRKNKVSSLNKDTDTKESSSYESSSSKQRDQSLPKGIMNQNGMTSRLTERDVGVTEYICSHEGFSGIIKQRFSDFHVNEIDGDGNVVVLTTTTPPELTDAEETKEKSEEYVKDVLPKDTLDKLKLLLESNGEDVEIEATTMSKEDRKKVHKAILLCCGKGRVTSNTKEKDGKKYITISKMKHNAKQDRRSAWPAERGDYVHFVLHKENMDTMETVNLIASKLRMKPNMITYAGTKDRRAKTSQLMSVHRVDPNRLASVGRSLYGVTIGNYNFKPKGLKLGDLKGNRFRIVLRNVTGSNAQIEQAMTSLKEKGFLNYYGLQRFGSSQAVPTHEIGKALLQGNWKEAVELILKPREGESFRELAEARKVWWETRDAAKAYKTLRSKDMLIEGKLLLGLSRHGPNDYINALENIPRNTRLLYLHSYQSLLWNKVASRRVKEFGLKPLEGDLVLQDEDLKIEIVDEPPPDEEMATTAEAMDENSSKRSAVRILTASELESVRIDEVVLPLPGHDITYPRNVTREWFEELLESDGLSSAGLKQTVRKYSVSGAYRRLVICPTNISWRTMHYSDPQTTLMLSDLEEMQKVSPPKDEPDGPYKALILDFCLPSSTYATMALREVLKNDTSSCSQASLNDYHVSRQTGDAKENGTRDAEVENGSDVAKEGTSKMTTRRNSTQGVESSPIKSKGKGVEQVSNALASKQDKSKHEEVKMAVDEGTTVKKIKTSDNISSKVEAQPIKTKGKRTSEHLDVPAQKIKENIASKKVKTVESTTSKVEEQTSTKTRGKRSSDNLEVSMLEEEEPKEESKMETDENPSTKKVKTNKLLKAEEPLSVKTRAKSTAKTIDVAPESEEEVKMDIDEPVSNKKVKPEEGGAATRTRAKGGTRPSDVTEEVEDATDASILPPRTRSKALSKLDEDIKTDSEESPADNPSLRTRSKVLSKSLNDSPAVQSDNTKEEDVTSRSGGNETIASKTDKPLVRTRSRALTKARDSPALESEGVTDDEEITPTRKTRSGSSEPLVRTRSKASTKRDSSAPESEGVTDEEEAKVESVGNATPRKTRSSSSEPSVRTRSKVVTKPRDSPVLESEGVTDDEDPKVEATGSSTPTKKTRSSSSEPLVRTRSKVGSKRRDSPAPEIEGNKERDSKIDTSSNEVDDKPALRTRSKAGSKSRDSPAVESEAGKDNEKTDSENKTTIREESRSPARTTRSKANIKSRDSPALEQEPVANAEDKKKAPHQYTATTEDKKEDQSPVKTRSKIAAKLSEVSETRKVEQDDMEVGDNASNTKKVDTDKCQEVEKKVKSKDEGVKPECEGDYSGGSRLPVESKKNLPKVKGGGNTTSIEVKMEDDSAPKLEDCSTEVCREGVSDQLEAPMLTVEKTLVDHSMEVDEYKALVEEKNMGEHVSAQAMENKMEIEVELKEEKNIDTDVIQCSNKICKKPSAFEKVQDEVEMSASSVKKDQQRPSDESSQKKTVEPSIKEDAASVKDDVVPSVESFVKDDAPSVESFVKGSEPSLDSSVKDDARSLESSVKDNVPLLEPSVELSVTDDAPSVESSEKQDTPPAGSSVNENTPHLELCVKEDAPSKEASNEIDEKLQILEESFVTLKDKPLEQSSDQVELSEIKERVKQSEESSEKLKDMVKPHEDLSEDTKDRDKQSEKYFEKMENESEPSEDKVKVKSDELSERTKAKSIELLEVDAKTLQESTQNDKPSEELCESLDKAESSEDIEDDSSQPNLVKPLDQIPMEIETVGTTKPDEQSLMEVEDSKSSELAMVLEDDGTLASKHVSSNAANLDIMNVNKFDRDAIPGEETVMNIDDRAESIEETTTKVVDNLESNVETTTIVGNCTLSSEGLVSRVAGAAMREEVADVDSCSGEASEKLVIETNDNAVSNEDILDKEPNEVPPTKLEDCTCTSNNIQIDTNVSSPEKVEEKKEVLKELPEVLKSVENLSKSLNIKFGTADVLGESSKTDSMPNRDDVKENIDIESNDEASIQFADDSTSKCQEESTSKPAKDVLEEVAVTYSVAEQESVVSADNIPDHGKDVDTSMQEKRRPVTEDIKTLDVEETMSPLQTATIMDEEKGSFEHPVLEESDDSQGVSKLKIEVTEQSSDSKPNLSVDNKEANELVETKDILETCASGEKRGTILSASEYEKVDHEAVMKGETDESIRNPEDGETLVMKAIASPMPQEDEVMEMESPISDLKMDTEDAATECNIVINVEENGKKSDISKQDEYAMDIFETPVKNVTKNEEKKATELKVNVTPVTSGEGNVIASEATLEGACIPSVEKNDGDEMIENTPKEISIEVSKDKITECETDDIKAEHDKVSSSLFTEEAEEPPFELKTKQADETCEVYTSKQSDNELILGEKGSLDENDFKTILTGNNELKIQGTSLKVKDDLEILNSEVTSHLGVNLELKTDGSVLESGVKVKLDKEQPDTATESTNKTEISSNRVECEHKVTSDSVDDDSINVVTNKVSSINTNIEQDSEYVTPDSHGGQKLEMKTKKGVTSKPEINLAMEVEESNLPSQKICFATGKHIHEKVSETVLTSEVAVDENVCVEEDEESVSRREDLGPLSDTMSGAEDKTEAVVGSATHETEPRETDGATQVMEVDGDTGRPVAMDTDVDASKTERALPLPNQGIPTLVENAVTNLDAQNNVMKSDVHLVCTTPNADSTAKGDSEKSSDLLVRSSGIKLCEESLAQMKEAKSCSDSVMESSDSTLGKTQAIQSTVDSDVGRRITESLTVDSFADLSSKSKTVESHIEVLDSDLENSTIKIAEKDESIIEMSSSIEGHILEACDKSVSDSSKSVDESCCSVTVKSEISDSPLKSTTSGSSETIPIEKPQVRSSTEAIDESEIDIKSSVDGSTNDTGINVILETKLGSPCEEAMLGDAIMEDIGSPKNKKMIFSSILKCNSSETDKVSLMETEEVKQNVQADLRVKPLSASVMEAENTVVLGTKLSDILKPPPVSVIDIHSSDHTSKVGIEFSPDIVITKPDVEAAKSHSELMAENDRKLNVESYKENIASETTSKIVNEADMKELNIDKTITESTSRLDVEHRMDVLKSKIASSIDISVTAKDSEKNVEMQVESVQVDVTKVEVVHISTDSIKPKPQNMQSMTDLLTTKPIIPSNKDVVSLKSSDVDMNSESEKDVGEVMMIVERIHSVENEVIDSETAMETEETKCAHAPSSIIIAMSEEEGDVGVETNDFRSVDQQEDTTTENVVMECIEDKHLESTAKTNIIDEALLLINESKAIDKHSEPPLNSVANCDAEPISLVEDASMETKGEKENIGTETVVTGLCKTVGGTKELIATTDSKSSSDEYVVCGEQIEDEDMKSVDTRVVASLVTADIKSDETTEAGMKVIHNESTVNEVCKPSTVSLKTEAGKPETVCDTVAEQEVITSVDSNTTQPGEVESAVDSKTEPEEVESAVDSKTEPEEMESAVDSKTDSEEMESAVDSKTEPAEMESALEIKTKPEEMESALECKTEPEEMESAVDSKAEPEEVELAVDTKVQPEEMESAVDSKTEPEKMELVVDSKTEPEEMESIVDSKIDPKEMESAVDSKAESEEVESAVDTKAQPEEMESAVDSKTEPEEMESAVDNSKTEPEEMESAVDNSKTEPEEMESAVDNSKTEPEELESAVDSKTEPEEMEFAVDSKTEPEEMESAVDSKTEPEEMESAVDSKTEPEEMKSAVDSKTEKVQLAVDSKAELEDVESAVDSKTEPEEMKSAVDSKTVPEKVQLAVDSKAEPEDVESAVDSKAEPEGVESAVDSKAEPEDVELAVGSKAEPEDVESAVDSKAQPEEMESAVDSKVQPEEMESVVESKTEPEEMESAVESKTEPEEMESAVESGTEPEEMESAVDSSITEPEEMLSTLDSKTEPEQMELTVESKSEPDEESIVANKTAPEAMESTLERETLSEAMEPALDRETPSKAMESALDTETAPETMESVLDKEIPPKALESALDRETESEAMEPAIYRETASEAIELVVARETAPKAIEPAVDRGTTPETMEPAVDRETAPIAMESVIDRETAPEAIESVVDKETAPEAIESVVDRKTAPEAEPAIDRDSAPEAMEPDIDGETAPEAMEPDIDGETAPETMEPAIDRETAPKSIEPAVDRETALEAMESTVDRETATKAIEPVVDGESTFKPMEPTVDRETTPEVMEPTVDEESAQEVMEPIVDSETTPEAMELVHDSETALGTIEPVDSKTEPETLVSSIGIKTVEFEEIELAVESKVVESEGIELAVDSKEVECEKRLLTVDGKSAELEEMNSVDNKITESEEHQSVVDNKGVESEKHDSVVDSEGADSEEHRSIVDSKGDKSEEHESVDSKGAEFEEHKSVIDSKGIISKENRLVVDSKGGECEEHEMVVDSKVSESEEHKSVVVSEGAESEEHEMFVGSKAAKSEKHMLIVDSKAAETEEHEMVIDSKVAESEEHEMVVDSRTVELQEHETVDSKAAEPQDHETVDTRTAEPEEHETVIDSRTAEPDEPETVVECRTAEPEELHLVGDSKAAESEEMDMPSESKSTEDEESKSVIDSRSVESEEMEPAVDRAAESEDIESIGSKTVELEDPESTVDSKAAELEEMDVAVDSEAVESEDIEPVDNKVAESEKMESALESKTAETEEMESAVDSKTTEPDDSKETKTFVTEINVDNSVTESEVTESTVVIKQTKTQAIGLIIANKETEPQVVESTVDTRMSESEAMESTVDSTETDILKSVVNSKPTERESIDSKEIESKVINKTTKPDKVDSAVTNNATISGTIESTVDSKTSEPDEIEPTIDCEIIKPLKVESVDCTRITIEGMKFADDSKTEPEEMESTVDDQKCKPKELQLIVDNETETGISSSADSSAVESTTCKPVTDVIFRCVMMEQDVGSSEASEAVKLDSEENIESTEPNMVAADAEPEQPTVESTVRVQVEEEPVSTQDEHMDKLMTGDINTVNSESLSKSIVDSTQETDTPESMTDVVNKSDVDSTSDIALSEVEPQCVSKGDDCSTLDVSVSESGVSVSPRPESAATIETSSEANATSESDIAQAESPLDTNLDSGIRSTSNPATSDEVVSLTDDAVVSKLDDDSTVTMSSKPDSSLDSEAVVTKIEETDLSSEQTELIDTKPESVVKAKETARASVSKPKDKGFGLVVESISRPKVCTLTESISSPTQHEICQTVPEEVQETSKRRIVCDISTPDGELVREARTSSSLEESLKSHTETTATLSVLEPADSPSESTDANTSVVTHSESSCILEVDDCARSKTDECSSVKRARSKFDETTSQDCGQLSECEDVSNPKRAKVDSSELASINVEFLKPVIPETDESSVLLRIETEDEDGLGEDGFDLTEKEEEELLKGDEDDDEEMKRDLTMKRKMDESESSVKETTETTAKKVRLEGTENGSLRTASPIDGSCSEEEGITDELKDIALKRKGVETTGSTSLEAKKAKMEEDAPE